MPKIILQHIANGMDVLRTTALKLLTRGIRTFPIAGVLTLGLLAAVFMNARCHAQALNAGSTFDTLNDWEVVLRDGATGTYALQKGGRTGQALRITKTNGLGYIEVRSRQPVKFNEGQKYSLRGWFSAQNAPISSLFLLRLGEYEASNFGNPHGLYEYTTTELIPNSPVGQWVKRVANYTATTAPNTDANFATHIPLSTHIHALLIGNPCSILLDDLEVTPVRANKGGSLPTLTDAVTQDAMRRRLAARQAVTLTLDTSRGAPRLRRNGKIIAPALYMTARLDATSGDLKSFGKAGINTVLIPVNMLGNENPDGLSWREDGTYNFAVVNRNVYQALRRNPEADIMLLVGAYAPPGWGSRNLNEVWRDSAGKYGYSGIGYGGATHHRGFVTDLSQTPAWEKAYYYPSYHSQKWRAEMCAWLSALSTHIRNAPYGKVVVGFQIMAGSDGRLQLGPDDFSAPALKGFQNWLRTKYGTIAALNAAWATTYSDFDDVPIKPSSTPPVLAAAPDEPPHIFDASVNDYRAFRRADGWKLMDEFAGALKNNLGKPSLMTVYRDMEPEFLSTQFIDAIGNDAFYPFRRPGYALPAWDRIDSHRHGKMQFQDIDMRSFAGPQENPETWEEHMGAALTQEEWLQTYRKLVGQSLGYNEGYWHYEQWGFFTDPWITQQIGKTRAIAQQIVEAPIRSYQPELLIVLSGRSKDYTRIPWHSVATSPGTSDLPMEFVMMFETSGVPYKMIYASDLTDPTFDTSPYKVVLFPHGARYTTEEKTAIEKLKNKNRTLVWVYNSGYIGERGVDVVGMRHLIGMDVYTDNYGNGTYSRLSPILLPHTLTSGAPPYQSISNLIYNNFKLHGLDSGKAPGQRFWIDDTGATPLARYYETNQDAAAIKTFPTWKSIYFAPAGGIDNRLINNIAKSAGALVAAPAGNQLTINGNFAAIHGLKTGSYTLRVPLGTTRVRDVFGARDLPIFGGKVTLHVEAQKSYWLTFH